MNKGRKTMAHLLVVIIHKASQLPELLEAWQAIGVPGVTALKSIGGHRAIDWLHQSGWDAIGELFGAENVRGKTLLSVIDNDDLLERAIIEAERVVGDFDKPGHGILFVVPVNRVIGIIEPEAKEAVAPPPKKSRIQELMTEAELVTRDTPVSVINQILNLKPVIVATDHPLMEVVTAMVDLPGINVACVVNPQQRLVGLIPLRSLADDLFMAVVPEEFFSETRDLEDALRFAKFSGTQTAEDAMIPAVWVKKEDTLKDAFRKLHDNQLSGMPIINDRYEVIGYISLLELLAIYARGQQDSDNQEE
jgi:CBS domain-containing protein